MATGPLNPDLLEKIDAYWRAANYLSVGPIDLLDNPLLSEPLSMQHDKPRLLGHWGHHARPPLCLRPSESCNSRLALGRQSRGRLTTRRHRGG